jgi:hypothetical protein
MWKNKPSVIRTQQQREKGHQNKETAYCVVQI